MRFDILTLFPGAFAGWSQESILRLAQEKGVARIEAHNLRAYSRAPHGKVDQPPYGGGPGMILQADPVFRAVESLRRRGREGSRLILLTPQGRPFHQAVADELTGTGRDLILVCGRYEGFDERVRTGLQPEEVSVGDYVLSGGEVAAMVVVDAVVRLLPGALGGATSTSEESFRNGYLEYPQYTRPVEYRGMRVPEVLLSGDHAVIAAWRREKARERTRQRRPDLLERTEGPRMPTP